MTDEHKKALAEGRTQGRAVRSYLDALETTKPKRGRKRTSDSIKKRLDLIETEPHIDTVRRMARAMPRPLL